MTSLDYFGTLLANESRITAFRQGIEAAVRPGDRVLDVGTGLGTYAFFAARAGAARVWAVEREAVAGVARQLAAANGLADRVEIVRGDALQVELPRDVDVLVFEDFPVTLLDRRTWELLRRVQGSLAVGGRMVPVAARLHVAPVHAPELWRRIFPFAGGDPAERRDVGGEGDPSWMGLDWQALRPLLANCPRQEMLLPRDLLAPAVSSRPVPLHPLPPADTLTVEGAWNAASSATVHALALWFDLEVGPGTWISNEPRPRPEPWGQTVLPVDPPLEVRAGSRVEVSVRREALPSGAPGWISWETSCGDEARQGHEFAGLSLDSRDLKEGGGVDREVAPADR